MVTGDSDGLGVESGQELFGEAQLGHGEVQWREDDSWAVRSGLSRVAAS